MKKPLFVILLLSLSIVASAQYVPKGKVTKAETALTQGKLDIAKAEIDEAFKIDAKGKVSKAAKNWYLKGRVYKAIFMDDSTQFKDLVDKETALKTAVDAFNKIKEMEKENSTYVIFADQELSALYAYILNKGAEEYNKKDYKAAYDNFNDALLVMPADTTALLYGGVAAQQAGLTDQAIEKYNKLIETGHADMDTYRTLIYLYRAEKEDLRAVINTINKALEKYPGDKELIQEKIRTLILMDQKDEAVKELNDAISKDPTNETFYYFLGYIYDQIGDSEKSIENYKKAIELKPDYFDANYNLAVVYYNMARDIYKELNDMSLEDYRKNEEEYLAKANEALENALPYFEKAAEVMPADNPDVQLLETLAGVYIRLHMNEKASEVQDRIKSITGQ